MHVHVRRRSASKKFRSLKSGSVTLTLVFTPNIPKKYEALPSVKAVPREGSGRQALTH